MHSMLAIPDAGTQITTEATRPFERISVDLGYQKGNNYLIGMDRYSGWPMASPIPRRANTKTKVF